MPKLKCHKINCQHNHDIKCGLEGIIVDCYANCDSFEHNLSEDFNMELARELSFTFTNRETVVSCYDRECMNNNNCQCMLENLRIDDMDGTARCVNFRKCH